MEILNNKILILGNGFDIANKLDTKYEDFILWLINSFFKELVNNRVYGNVLVKIDLNKHDKFRINGLCEYLNDLQNKSQRKYQFFDSIPEYQLFYENYKTCIFYDTNYPINNFFESIMNDLCTKRWVDIEQVYFNTLKKIIFNSDKSVKSNIESRKIENLNEKLQFLSKKLAEYLQTLEAKIDKNIELSYAFKLYDILGINSKTKGSIILNFNYTNTINNYIDIYNSYSKYFPFQLINIHGELNSKTNPIVFGYGDESNDEYKIIENLDDNKLMHFFKSFWYSKTNNYKSLLDYLNLGDYEVYVLGHSCGLSDRVLLKTIFENKRCKKIHLFHYGNDFDFKQHIHFQNYIQVSRHFSDKAKMREIVGDFNEKYSLE